MNISLDRISKDLDYVTGIKNPDYKEGCTRHSYSEEDRKARDYIMPILEEMGLEITVDGVGNVRAKYNPNKTDLPSVMIGSHIDTVTSGGRFDGLLGVLSSIEVIRTINENNLPIKNPIELVIFAEEEGSNFGITMLGSKILSGKKPIESLKEIYKGEETAYEIIKKAGYPIDEEYRPIRKDEVKAMVELHIEQGAILDSKNISIGVVHKIAGMTTTRVRLFGVSNHAGTTPMYLRKDPVVAFGDIVGELTREIRSIADNDTAVATVGKLQAYPNNTNVIAHELEFYVDIRDVVESGLEEGNRLLEAIVEEVSKKYELDYEMERIANSPIVSLSDTTINTIRESAEDMSLDYLDMNSGAVHDSVMMTDLAQVGMIFVPSIDGYSHSPEEDTDMKDIEKGANLLLHSVIELAK